MDPMRELPLGFGLALCANQPAAERFAQLSPGEKRRLIEGTHHIQSSAEMRAYVAALVE